jgi:hypothetical protein
MRAKYWDKCSVLEQCTLHTDKNIVFRIVLEFLVGPCFTGDRNQHENLGLFLCQSFETNGN